MRLKQITDDFKVTEVAKPPRKNAEGKYTYFWLEKTNYTTVRALQTIARALRISNRRLHFSGTKDKFAVTKQLVSVMHLGPEKLAKLNLKDIKVTPLHLGKERITLGDHQANKFEIVVRDLPSDFSTNVSKKSASDNKNSHFSKLAQRVDSQSTSKRMQSIQLRVKKGYPNYFDEQRFSSNNAEVGKALLQGDIQKAVELVLSKDDESEKLVKEKRFRELANHYDKRHSSERTIASWLINLPNDYAGAFRNLHKKVRMLYVHSYQSALFNRALSATIKKPYANLTINKESLAIGSTQGKELILPGYKTKLSNSEYNQNLASELKKDGIALDDFKLPRTPELASYGGLRFAAIKPAKLKLGKPVKDELNPGKKKIKITFELTKGAYATLLIKILFSAA